MKKIEIVGLTLQNLQPAGMSQSVFYVVEGIDCDTNVNVMIYGHLDK